jgi:hypothetical protein
MRPAEAAPRITGQIVLQGGPVLVVSPTANVARLPGKESGSVVPIATSVLRQVERAPVAVESLLSQFVHLGILGRDDRGARLAPIQ